MATSKKIAEWQLLLATITLPGVFIGALLCNRLGRRNTVGPLLNPPYLDQTSPLADPRVHWLHNYR